MIYIVSEDIVGLLTKWATARGFVLPPSDFFCHLRKQLASHLNGILDCEVVIVAEEKITEGLKKLTSSCKYPVVSMDGAYIQTPLTLSFNRAVNRLGDDAGLVPRFNSPPIATQLAVLNGWSEVVLLDDVVYSGHQMMWVIKQIEQQEVRVKQVLSGIVIDNGRKFLEQEGIEVISVLDYCEVLDEICERDFYPGVPGCGRFVVSQANTGIPYLLPFGRPSQWASVPPQSVIHFSQGCLELTINLFEAIEDYSNRFIYGYDVDRRVLGQIDEDRFVDFLHQSINRLGQL